MALRSTVFPHGLPELERKGREKDKEKVENGNFIASYALELVADIIGRRKYFLLENPANSLFWALPGLAEIRQAPGVYVVTFSNCMFEGGVRDKQTSLLTNAPGVGAALQDLLCTNKAICDRTGKEHATWRPVVVDGIPVAYPTADEAEYPPGLCRILANVVHELASVGDGDLVFMEVFSGPRAPLSFAVAERLRSSS